MWVLTGERECFCGIHISGKSIRIVDDAPSGVEAGSWYAWPSTHVEHELIAAGS
jgi:hypothetical protein